MKPDIGITVKHLQKSADLLSVILSDEVTLYMKTRKFHWNVKGESFMEFHKLFEAQYSELEESIDSIAERIGKLGENTIGTMQEFSKLALLKERPGEYSGSRDMVKELLADHETVIVELRAGIKDSAEKYLDSGTADFLTGLMEQHESAAWVLRRYLN